MVFNAYFCGGLTVNSILYHHFTHHEILFKMAVLFEAFDKTIFHEEYSKMEKNTFPSPLPTSWQRNILHTLSKSQCHFVLHLMPIRMVYWRSHDNKMAPPIKVQCLSLQPLFQCFIIYHVHFTVFMYSLTLGLQKLHKK